MAARIAPYLRYCSSKQPLDYHGTQPQYVRWPPCYLWSAPRAGRVRLPFPVLLHAERPLEEGR